YHLRLPLDRDQDKDVGKAVEVTRAAFLDTLAEVASSSPPPRTSRASRTTNTANTTPAHTIRTETGLEAHLQYGMLRRSPYGLAFPSIIAGGRNATVLHYLKNDEPLPANGLVLMDFGA